MKLPHPVLAAVCGGAMSSTLQLEQVFAFDEQRSRRIRPPSMRDTQLWPISVRAHLSLSLSLSITARQDHVLPSVFWLRAADLEWFNQSSVELYAELVDLLQRHVPRLLERFYAAKAAAPTKSQRSELLVRGTHLRCSCQCAGASWNVCANAVRALG